MEVLIGFIGGVVIVAGIIIAFASTLGADTTGLWIAALMIGGAVMAILTFGFHVDLVTAAIASILSPVALWLAFWGIVK